jgi:hypothetical protein
MGDCHNNQHTKTKKSGNERPTCMSVALIYHHIAQYDYDLRFYTTTSILLGTPHLSWKTLNPPKHLDLSANLHS